MGSILLELLNSVSDENKHSLNSKLRILVILIISSYYSHYVYQLIYGEYILIDFSNLSEIYRFFIDGGVFQIGLIFLISVLITVNLKWLIILLNNLIKYITNIIGITFNESDLVSRAIVNVNGNSKTNITYSIYKLLYLDTNDEVNGIIGFFTLLLQIFTIIIFGVTTEYMIPYLNILIIILFIISYLFQYYIYRLNEILQNNGYQILSQIEKKISDSRLKNIDPFFDSDRPIQKRENSIFSDRTDFSELLYNQIIAYNGHDSIVIGINGEWGEGKTSLVNLAIEPILDSKHSNHYVLYYNPWNFSNSQELISNFLYELKIFIRKLLGNAKTNNFEELLLTYISHITTDEVDESKDPYFTDENTYNIKNEIQEQINSFELKIIVVIDDIDRLDKSETLDVFKLVKAIGDFNNIIYILPYDKKRILNLLDISDDYIKKIIQQEIELPPIDPSILYNILNDRIFRLIKEFNLEQYWESKRWEALSNSGLINYIKNLRDVNKLINTLRFRISDRNYHDLDIVDFVSITIIQLFDYNLYTFIFSSKSYLIDSDYQPGSKLNKNIFEELDSKEFTIKLKNKISVVKLILSELFPLSGAGMGRQYQNENFASQWRKNHRICSVIYFDKYFLYKTNSEIISRVEFENINSSVTNKNEFTRNLIQLAKEGRLEFYLKRFSDYYYEQYIQNNIENIISSFLTIKDNKIQTRTTLIGNFSVESFLLFHIEKLGFQIDLFNNENLLNKLILENNHDINLVVEFYLKICYVFGIKEKDTVNLELINENAILKNVYPNLIKKLRESFIEITKSNNFPSIIHYWKKIDKEFDINDLMNNYFSSNNNVIHFLHLLKSIQYINSNSTGYLQRELFHIEYIKEIVDFELFVARTDELKLLLSSNNHTEFDDYKQQFFEEKEILDKCISGEIDINDRNWHKQFND